jgi:hypothetical protein
VTVVIKQLMKQRKMAFLDSEDTLLQMISACGHETGESVKHLFNKT